MAKSTPHPSQDATPQRLRDAVLDVERLREQEEAARKEAEALVAGLRVLVDADTVREMFDGILVALHGMVPFTEAAILIEKDRLFHTASTTSQDFSFSRIEPKKTLLAVLDGKPAAIASLAKLEEWRQIQPQVPCSYQSALLAPLAGHRTRGILMCVHTAKCWFAEPHLRAVETFAPLAAQALQKEEQREELEQMVGRLDHLARHDPLTGLTNLSAFKACLTRAFRDARRSESMVGVLMIDLDDFKTINDTLGHSAGDAMLCEMAQRLSQVLRGGDVVARLGGDEFAAQISGLRELADAVAIANKILNEMSKPLVCHGQKIYPAASVGIAAYPLHGMTPDAVLKHADIAMYHAKAEGKNTVHLFSEVLRTEVSRRHSVETLLRRALGTADFMLHYQPILDLRRNETVGLEALLRWHHPERGLVAPAAFLDVAVQTRLIVPIGHWVLDTACAELGAWLRRPGHRVAVNIAPPQLLALDFVGKIEQAITENGLAPDALELELSEDIIANKVTERAFAGLRALDGLGVQFAFDDFGTGSASIAHLRRFPGKRLKIDRGFIGNMLQNRKDRALVCGIINLAHSLGLSVVAEGVETEQQLEFLRDEGCDEAQGFLLGRPQPAKAVLAEWRATDDIVLG